MQGTLPRAQTARSHAECVGRVVLPSQACPLPAEPGWVGAKPSALPLPADPTACLGQAALKAPDLPSVKRAHSVSHRNSG